MKILDWIQHIDILSLVLGAVLGTLLSTWLGYFIKRPRIQVTGSGSGGGPGHHSNSITVSNTPGLLGWKIRETVIFGWRIYNAFENGLVINREPAHECKAFLYDKQSKQLIKPLFWRDINESNKFTQTVTLESGKSASLMLFARLDSEPKKYFVFEPTALDNGAPKVPDEDVRFDSSRDFIIEIRHSYGKKVTKIDYKMIKGFDGRISYQSNSSGGSF